MRADDRAGALSRYFLASCLSTQSCSFVFARAPLSVANQNITPDRKSRCSVPCSSLLRSLLQYLPYLFGQGSESERLLQEGLFGTQDSWQSTISSVVTALKEDL